MNKIGFIGLGNMATAIISGISKSKLDVELFGFDLDTLKLENLNEFNVTPCKNIFDLCQNSQFLFLAIKPQSFAVVLNNIKDCIKKDTVIISIAAGITSDLIRDNLGFTAKIVRVMPNTPLLIGEGSTALSKCENVSDDEFIFVNKIFSVAGVTEIVPMDKMNEIISINGSSPAFIYEFARCFIEYGKNVNLDEKTCLNLFAQALIGSATMITKSGYSIEQLIEMVSSKGGTTIAGLKSFKSDNLSQIVQNACEKCTSRAYELEKSFNQ